MTANSTPSSSAPARPARRWPSASPSAGKSVAIIERKHFGGTCVNTGCIPTKTLVASAYAAHLARRAAEYGVDVGGQVKVDMKRVKARKDSVSRALAQRRRALDGAACQCHRLPRPRALHRAARR